MSDLNALGVQITIGIIFGLGIPVWLVLREIREALYQIAEKLPEKP